MNRTTERSPKISLYIMSLSAVLSLACFSSATLQASSLSSTSPAASYQASTALSAPDAATQMRISENYGKLPLSFELNQGQTDEAVKFFSRGQGYNLFLTADEAVLALSRPQNITQSAISSKDSRPAQSENLVVRMSLVGANTQPEIVGEEPLPGKSNYFTGSNADDWHTDVAQYAKVHYRDVYPGVDLVYYGNQQQLEYDLVVAPGADPKQIRLGFKGADRISLDAEGNLILHTAAGNLTEHKPVIYQEVKGKRKLIDGAYVLQDNRQVSFKIASYDAKQPLVIDPVIVYSTFLGGSDSDTGTSIAVDSASNAYVTGSTGSINFPTTAGGFDRSCAGTCGFFTPDIFVTKLNAAGTALLYSTFIGGSGAGGRGDESATGIAIDGAGNAYLTGVTGSADFPTTPGAFDRSPTNLGPNSVEGFVVKLNASGNALIYSTYLGGSFNDRGNDIAVGSGGNAFITGFTFSADFPTTPGAFDRTFNGSNAFDSNAFVTRLNTSGTGLVYSTFLGGGEGTGIVINSARNVYVTGNTAGGYPTTSGAFDRTCGCAGGPPPSEGGGAGGVTDGFITKLAPAGNALVYSTYLGGSNADSSSAIAIDGAGNAYVAGETISFDNFPTTPGAFDRSGQLKGSSSTFVSKLNAAGTALVYSTFLEGSRRDVADDVAVDGNGNAYVTGTTTSLDFPITANAFDQVNDVRGAPDLFVTKLNAAGTGLVYSSYLGGRFPEGGGGIAIDGSGNAYVTGNSESTDFPTSSGAFDRSHNGSSDVIVTKISP